MSSCPSNVIVFFTDLRRERVLTLSFFSGPFKPVRNGTIPSLEGRPSRLVEARSAKTEGRGGLPESSKFSSHFPLEARCWCS